MKRIGIGAIFVVLSINVYGQTANQIQGAEEYDWQACITNKVSECLNTCATSEDPDCKDTCQSTAKDKCLSKGLQPQNNIQ